MPQVSNFARVAGLDCLAGSNSSKQPDVLPVVCRMLQASSFVEIVVGG